MRCVNIKTRCSSVVTLIVQICCMTYIHRVCHYHNTGHTNVDSLILFNDRYVLHVRFYRFNGIVSLKLTGDIYADGKLICYIVVTEGDRRCCAREPYWNYCTQV